MDTTTVTLHSEFQIGPVDPRIFGGFIEHMGRCVYEGVYHPESKHADADGFRTDVLGALRRLRITAMRYPGGNFVSGYHWKDGVGPKMQRPTVLELAWHTREPNHFGTDEFIKMCRLMSWTPMIAVNLGTGTPEEARNWVEYSNCPPGTQYADMRRANGNSDPFGVPLWCLGNEMDGRWQLGHMPANEYAIRAQQAAKLMRGADKSIELVVCGSCSINLPTYMAWDREVLEYIGDDADYVSLHRYVGNRDNDTANFLAITNSIDKQIEDMDAACRFAQAKRRSKQRLWLCFDEWNVAYKQKHRDPEGVFPRRIAEEVYNLEDALVVAGFFHSFVRHADVLKIANIAQVVNVLAPIMTRGDDLLIQSIFYPFEMFSTRRDGVSLRPVVAGPRYESKSYGEVTYIDASAILSDGLLHVFLTNRSLSETAAVDLVLADKSLQRLASAEILTGSDAKTENTWERQEVVAARPFTAAQIADGRATVRLPPLSFVAATFAL